jgi:acyl-CoA thioester hydrolase
MTSSSVSADGGLPVYRTEVLDRWVDHNGHMNVASYLTAFDAAICAFCTGCGIGPDRIEQTGKTVFVAQANIVYRRELHRADPIAIDLRILDLAEDRLHVYMTMHDVRDRHVAAANEQLLVCVSMKTRRPTELSEDVYGRFASIFDRQKGFPSPRYAGRLISLRRD